MERSLPTHASSDPPQEATERRPPCGPRQARAPHRDHTQGGGSTLQRAASSSQGAGGQAGSGLAAARGYPSARCRRKGSSGSAAGSSASASARHRRKIRQRPMIAQRSRAALSHPIEERCLDPTSTSPPSAGALGPLLIRTARDPPREIYSSSPCRAEIPWRCSSDVETSSPLVAVPLMMKASLSMERMMCRGKMVQNVTLCYRLFV
ncbi:uncharacterized protein LOC120676199 [Panicum virgatum]|uniref:Uncharacterized protein n=1 Tax=Panicum virgatum TaxID=38727 RepID=A0A8T0RV49_PANVG|nr:uncharacterized protein LOC120676199 [Panicum virgatum]KAG2590271.1 hypothetical protein PVAP13_5NG259200 [Panicum virgatum]